MLKIKLRRSVLQGRRAYTFESLEVDGRKTKEVLIRTPDGEVHLAEGDTDYARDFPRLFMSIISGAIEWSGHDTITLDNVPY